MKVYNKDRKEKHTSIAVCKIRLDNGSVVDVYGYDEIADVLYKNDFEYIYVEGKMDNNMMVEIHKIR